MKRILLSLLVGISVFAAVQFKPSAQESRVERQISGSAVGEYATIRFMEERTSIVWPNGDVEGVQNLIPKKKFEGGERYPKGSDFRMYWLTVAMNHLASKGFELAH
jgi:hypothetical protein